MEDLPTDIEHGTGSITIVAETELTENTRPLTQAIENMRAERLAARLANERVRIMESVFVPGTTNHTVDI